MSHVKRPGLVLRDTFLRPLKIDLVTLHFLTNLPTHRLQEIVSGQRAIDRRDACCFGDTFGTGAEFWLELQEAYENEQHAQRNALPHDGVTKLLFAPKEPR